MPGIRFALAVIICIIFTAPMVMADEGMDMGNEQYVYTEYPLERNGISLHLDRMELEGAMAEKNILLLHGSSNASHEFDMDYQDYSLVRRLAREGYQVWRLDIAGYGQSENVADGLLPDTAYAAEDIKAAVDRILQETGQRNVDLLGWSWGTMTASLYAMNHPEHVRKLVLYGPILTGIGEAESYPPFSHNTWEQAAEDFQRREDGTFDLSVTDPVIIELFCSSCWHYDGEYSPNGWRKDACVDKSQVLIDLDAIRVPTLLICGGKDPYMNYEIIDGAMEHLPEGSAVEVIPGGSHIVMLEKPYYRDFQERVAGFLQ